MNALAQLLRAHGFAVSGSDRFLDSGEQLEVFDRLRAAGARLVAQDGGGVTPGGEVVLSTAIEPDNPDLVAARRQGCRVWHRAELLARLARGRRCVAVTGTAGKTTVTGLLGWILESAGFDPTVVNGDAVLNWAGPDRIGNVRVGASDWWVVEVDESDRSLLYFDPAWIVLTNISKDHFELDEVLDLFRRFAAKAAVAVSAGPGVRALLGPGFENANEDPFTPVAGRPGQFEYEGLIFETILPGRHNLENAFLAVSACRRLGLDLDRVREALRSFRGIRRRLEIVGETGGVRVIDDYAHNPAKISATWQAVAETAGRVLAVWRPHGYGPLALMKQELADAFHRNCRPSDRIFLLPVFYAGGTAATAFGSAEFARLLKDRDVPAEYVSGYDSLAGRLQALARPGDHIVCMGARDPELPRFARRLATDLLNRDGSAV
jgi:UDP-N-acetylmuramate--alanine ligase